MGEVGVTDTQQAVVDGETAPDEPLEPSGKPDASADRVGPAGPADRFRRHLLAIAGAALVLRVVIVLTSRSSQISNDGYFYSAGANLIADGHFYVNPLGGGPLAAHPPGWSTVLALPALLGFRTVLQHQLFGCLLGAVTVTLIGLGARAITRSNRIGLLAAGVAALYPNLWLHERELGSETLSTLLAALTLLVAYRHLRTPSWVSAAGLGALCALNALARSEQALLVVVLLVPVVWLAGRDRIPLPRASRGSSSAAS